MFKVLSAAAFAALLLASCQAKSTPEKSIISSDNSKTNTVEPKKIVENSYKKSKNINGLIREVEANHKPWSIDNRFLAAIDDALVILIERTDDYVLMIRFEEVNKKMKEVEFSDPQNILAQKYKGDKEVWKKEFISTFGDELIVKPPPSE